MAARNPQGAQPRTPPHDLKPIDLLPEATVIRYLLPVRKGGAWRVWIRCPHCRKRHLHGAGSGSTPHAAGSRAPHCTGTGALLSLVGEYTIVDDAAKAARAAARWRKAVR